MKTLIISLLTVFMTTTLNSAVRIAKDSIETKDGKILVLGAIKHGSIMMTFEGKTIYIDPVSEYADYSALPKADVILITHEHDDHLDSKAVEALEKEGTKIVANQASVGILGKGTAMANGNRLSPVPWLKIEAVPAYNTTEDRQKFHPHNGRDNGYILTIGGSRIYVAGDAEFIPEMKSFKNIDVAFIPVNQPYTMTVVQAIEAAKAIQPKILYPYHYGETKIQELVTGLKSQKNIEVRVRNLQ